MKSEAGKRLPVTDVRAAMIIRDNTHLLGLSGLRLKLVRRMLTLFHHSNVEQNGSKF
jgi:phenylalanine ammonia-lyase